MRPCVLVAGVGTVGRGDDGFGIEVVRRLADEVLPVWVQLAEHGIGCGRLGRDLLGDYDTTVLLGATATGAVPGRIRVTETDLGDLSPEDGPAAPAPAAVGADVLADLLPPGVAPTAARTLLRVLGGDAGRVIVVSCVPARTTGFGLSPRVAEAAREAVHLVTDLVWGERPGLPSPRVEAESPRQLQPVRGE